MKIVFFGTPLFAKNILRYLVDNGIDVVGIVTRPDRPKGRSGKATPPPVKVFAQESLPSVPVFQPEKVSTPENEQMLADLGADLFVVVAYGEILKQHLLDVPSLGCLNVHASLLPKYRGAAPIQRAIIDGEASTGVTIMRMVRKMDAGAIFDAAPIQIAPNMTGGELEEQLCQLGAQRLLYVLQHLDTIQETPQDESEVTFAPKITPDDTHISWKASAIDVHNKIRALSPRPTAWCKALYNEKNYRIKIGKSILLLEVAGAPGEVVSHKDYPVVVACGAGAVALTELQMEGKRMMPAQEFVRGLTISNLKICV